MNSQTVPILEEMITNMGRTVAAISHQQTVMLLFLRQFGCIFCREGLADLSEKKSTYEKEGIHLVFVHMSDHALAETYFEKYNLGDCEHVSDPSCHYYAAMGLTKGTFSQLFGLQVMIRGFEASLVKGHNFSRQIGDGFQMPGVFLIQNGKVVEKFIHKLASDRPNYDALLSCCVIPQ